MRVIFTLILPPRCNIDWTFLVEPQQACQTRNFVIFKHRGYVGNLCNAIKPNAVWISMDHSFNTYTFPDTSKYSLMPLVG